MGRRHERLLRRQLAACTWPPGDLTCRLAEQRPVCKTWCATGSASANDLDSDDRVGRYKRRLNSIQCSRRQTVEEGQLRKLLPRWFQQIVPCRRPSPIDGTLAEPPLDRVIVDSPSRVVAEQGLTLITRESELVEVPGLVVVPDCFAVGHRTSFRAPVSKENGQPFALAQPVAHPPQAGVDAHHQLAHHAAPGQGASREL